MKLSSFSSKYSFKHFYFSSHSFSHRFRLSLIGFTHTHTNAVNWQLKTVSRSLCSLYTQCNCFRYTPPSFHYMERLCDACLLVRNLVLVRKKWGHSSFLEMISHCVWPLVVSKRCKKCDVGFTDHGVNGPWIHKVCMHARVSACQLCA